MTFDRKAPRPETRKYIDPYYHVRNVPYLRQKAQAIFRGEIWNITFLEWCSFWTEDLWNKRGKSSDNVCMTRIDYTKPWTADNVKVVTRNSQIKEALNQPGRKRRGKNKKGLKK